MHRINRDDKLDSLITLVVIACIYLIFTAMLSGVGLAVNKVEQPESSEMITAQEIETDIPIEAAIEPEPITEVIEEPPIDPDELEMLACVIYQEAGGDAFTDECRRMVADVVLNRVEDDRFPDTMYEVLTAKRQYGRYYWTGIVWPERASYDVEKEAVERAYRIAEEVLRGQHSVLYGCGYIWQAEFKQGTDVIYLCETYFGK